MLKNQFLNNQEFISTIYRANEQVQPVVWDWNNFHRNFIATLEQSRTEDKEQYDQIQDVIPAYLESQAHMSFELLRTKSWYGWWVSIGLRNE